MWMIKRLIFLTWLVAFGLMIAKGQSGPSALEQEAQKEEEIKLPDVEHDLCHKDFIRFWRMTLDGQKGNWHLYNEEDKHFLDDVQRRINSGQYGGSKVEWVAIEGRLPK